MKKRSILFCMIFFLAALCTGCMPPGYSQQHAQEVRDTYSGEAKAWFSSNMPDAKVLSTRAYSDGMHLYSIIDGRYSTKNGEFDYCYDYDSDTMYLGEPYEKAVVVAEQELAAALGISTEQMRFYPRGWHILVESEDDRNPNQYANAGTGKIQTSSLSVLPAGSDPNEFGRKMIYEGLPDGDGSSPSKCGAFIYVNTLPDYDRDLFANLAGVSYLHYTQPADPYYDGVYGATYSDDSCVLQYLHLEDGGSGRSVGYTYEIRDEFTEDGTLVLHEDPGENGLDDMNVQISGSSVSFHIPKEAEPIVLAPRGKYHFDTTDGSGNPYVIDWYQEMSETKTDYLYGKNLSYFSTMAFPKGDFCLYTMTSKTDRTEFNFR